MLCALVISISVIFTGIIFFSLIICPFICLIFISHISIYADFPYIMDCIHITTILVFDKKCIQAKRGNQTFHNDPFIFAEQIGFWGFSRIILKIPAKFS